MALPKLLAGPIIRRVDKAGATFWLAFSEQVTVTAKVWLGEQTSAGAGSVVGGAPAVAESLPVQTRRFGAKLHIVAVTTTIGVIAPGALHAYDIVVSGTGGLSELGLLRESTGTPEPGIHPEAPRGLPLGYATNRLPMFLGPAPSVDALRFAHTSCRKPHGGGPDALAWLDDEIRRTRLDANLRPQVLFLTGDQIYADDVAACLLPMLTDLGGELLEFEETVPLRTAQLGPNVVERAPVKDLPALRRARTVIEAAKLSTTEGANHLLGFGEFAAMYLAAWSPRVWRALATSDSLFQGVPFGRRQNLLLTDHETWWQSEGRGAATDAEAVRKWRETDQELTQRKDGGTGEAREAVQRFIASVPNVARLLANVPTMMIFDDHEITDDWYISAPWRTRVLVTPLGRTLIRNGLMAYTVFQAIGNDPPQWREPPEWDAGTAYPLGSIVRSDGGIFTATVDMQPDPVRPSTANAKWNRVADVPPGPTLLTAIETLMSDGATPTAAHLTQLDQLLGLTGSAATPQVSFHYALDGAKHRFVVLDTRTHRTYSSQTRHAPPALLGKDMAKMVPAGPLTDGRELLIVVSPAPLLIPRIFDTLAAPAMAAVFDVKAHFLGTEKYDPGDPKPPSLVGSETADLEGWGANEPPFREFVRHLATYPRVVAIGGDVHFASSMAVDVWTKSGGTAAVSRILQCTASAAKNEWPKTAMAILRAQRSAQKILQGTPVEQLGWDADHGVVLPAGAHIRPGRRARLLTKPTFVPAGGWPTGTTLDSAKPPDARLRIQVLRDARPSQGVGAPAVPELNEWSPDPAKIFENYANVARKHQRLLTDLAQPVRTVVFSNNVGIVSFTSPSSGEYVATHALMSVAGDGTTGGAFTHHVLDLARAAAGAAPTLTVGGA
jgi:hypothetical protein